MQRIAQALIIFAIGIEAVRVHSVSEAEAEAETGNTFNLDSLAKMAKD